MLLEWLYSSQTDIKLFDEYGNSNKTTQQSCRSEEMEPTGIKVADYSCDE